MKKRAGPDDEINWTVLVFMIGDEALDPHIRRDLIEMRRVGSSDRVKVAVQLQRGAGTRIQRFQLEEREPPTLEARQPPPVKLRLVSREPGESVSDVDTIGAFLDWGLKRFKKSRHFALVLWGHALGVGFGRLGPKNEQDLLLLSDLAGALCRFQTKRGGTPLEILGFCACATSKAEFAHEFNGCVDYLVSSQVGLSVLTTWPFDAILEKLVASPDMDSQRFSETIVRVFREACEPPTIALTALNVHNNRIGDIVGSIADAIMEGFSIGGQESELIKLCVLQAFRAARKDNPYEGEPVVDFVVLCEALVDELVLIEQVAPRASPIIKAARRVLDRGKGDIVSSHMAIGPKMGKLNGLTILAPIIDIRAEGVSTWAKFYTTRKKDRLPRLWRDTRWPEVIEQLFRFGQSQTNLPAV